MGSKAGSVSRERRAARPKGPPDRKGRSYGREKRSYERIVVLPDLHEPYRDTEAFEAAIAFTGRVRPALVVIIGDWIDFYQLSRFVKDPARKLELQADLDAASKSLSRVRRAAPHAKIVFCRGNHEYRLTKHLWGTESPLASLRGLQVPELLNFSEHKIEYASQGQVTIGSLTFKHGSFARNRSGYTASAELDRMWRSGISGHTHRLGQIYRTTEAGNFTWIESGCLCRLDPEYAEGSVVDWQHGLAYAEVERNGNRFIAQAIPIVKGKIVWGGVEIRG